MLSGFQHTKILILRFFRVANERTVEKSTCRKMQTVTCCTNKMNSRKEITCPTCIMKPVISVAKLFGMDIILDCDCQPVIRRSKFIQILYKMYLRFLEIYWWFNVTNCSLLIVDKGLICDRPIEIFGEGSIIMKYIFVFGLLFNAIMRSTFCRMKMPFLKRKHFYMDESERFREVELFSIMAFVLLTILLMGFKIGCEMILYPFLIEKSASPQKALFCTVYINILFSFLYIEIGLITLQILVFCWIGYKRFEQLAKDFIEIEKESIDLQLKLNDLMNKHDELLYYIEQSNDTYQHIFPAMYGYFILEDTLCICAVLFMRTNALMKLICCTIAVIFSSSIISLSYFITRTTAQIYGPFKEMEKFSSCNLRLKYKLKLLNFMKRFAKVPIGLSIGGFFHVKKNFIVRIVSAKESFLSSLMSLAEEKPTVNCSARNSNTTSKWFA